MKIVEYYYRAYMVDGKCEEMVSLTAQNNNDLRRELNDPRTIFLKAGPTNMINYTINKMHIVRIESHHVKYEEK